jgi:hypothetical protein
MIIPPCELLYIFGNAFPASGPKTNAAGQLQRDFLINIYGCMPYSYEYSASGVMPYNNADSYYL